MTARSISLADVPALLAGAEFFSTSAAGEGIEFVGVWLEDILAHTGPVQLVTVDELDPDALCVAVGLLGSPVPMSELPPSGDEPEMIARSLAGRLGSPPAAVMALNAANVNALLPVAAAAVLGLPLIDCDGMGRVFPLIHQTTYELAGLPLTPLATVSTGHDLTLLETSSARAERIARSLVRAAGGWLLCGIYPGPAGRLREAAIHGSMSRLIDVGQVLRAHAPSTMRARELGDVSPWPAFAAPSATPPQDPDSDGPPPGPQAAHRLTNAPAERLLRALSEATGARTVGSGRVVEVGPSVGQAVYPGNPINTVVHDQDSGRLIRLEAYTELLLALTDGALTAAVPDLICLLDKGTLRMTGPERLTAGDQVSVLCVPAAPVWRTAAGLALAGPRAFGYSLRHPCEEGR
ncbi:DUF917 domain-containing protein [Streptomyces sp. MS06]|uniref:DUF917 domain-containing protein n=1 Tax=Streptomyces sp. MS06 TaxID=3385974 RepID=UPI00399F9B37